MLASARSRLWLAFASAAYALLLVALRGRPSLKSDSGVFLSVAGRLLHGDRLYVNVFDNKDPLFFYSHAAALGIFGWAGPFLLDVIWVAIAAGSTLLLLRALGASWLTAGVGFVAYPLLLTGEWYYAGYSLLAALSFAPLIGWLWLRQRFALAGALFAVGLLYKVNLALVIASVPLAIVLLRPPARPLKLQVARAAIGAGAVLAATAIALALAGELHGYLETLVNNVSYSREVLRTTGNPPGVPGHIKVAAWAASQPGHLAGVAVGKPLHLAVVVALFLAAGLLAIGSLWRVAGRWGKPSPDPVVRALAALYLCSVATTAVTLALTAAWFPHGQMLAFPSFALIVFLVARIKPEMVRMPRPAIAVAIAVVGLVALGGTAAARHARDGGIGSWFQAGHSRTANLLMRTADVRFPQLHTITFAHLGQNDEEGAAAFLDDRFVLACPAIAQYLFTPDLGSVLHCIRSKKPQLILVTAEFRAISGAQPAWNKFVADGSSLLARSYQRLSTHRTETGIAAVWALPGIGRAGVAAPARRG
jgi:hypothetical protein